MVGGANVAVAASFKVQQAATTMTLPDAYLSDLEPHESEDEAGVPVGEEGLAVDRAMRQQRGQLQADEVSTQTGRR